MHFVGHPSCHMGAMSRADTQGQEGYAALIMCGWLHRNLRHQVEATISLQIWRSAQPHEPVLQH